MMTPVTWRIDTGRQFAMVGARMHCHWNRRDRGGVASKGVGSRALRRLPALLGILIVAFNLRTVVAAFSPIIDRIEGDISLDSTLLGVIGALPPLAFGLCGIIAPAVAHRVGLERGLLMAIGAMTIGHLGRSLAPDSVLLIAATATTALGVGVGNVLLPPLIRRYFPDRIGVMTGVYVVLLSLGTSLPPLLAVPVATSAGWRISLGIWFVVSAIAAAPWLLQLRTNRVANRRDQPMPEEPRGRQRTRLRLWRSWIAWALAAVFAASSVIASASFAWMPVLLVERAGLSEAQAGFALALFGVAVLPFSLVVPLLAERLRWVAPIIVVGFFAAIAGTLGLLAAPSAFPMTWVLLLGIATLWFPLILLLVNTRARTDVGGIALSGFVQGIGYVAGSAGSFAFGLLHALTGDWTAALIFLLAVVALVLPATIVLARPGYVEGQAGVGRRGGTATTI